MTGKAGIRGMESADRAEKDKAGKVWLVGAGCGGPELITVKGLSLVESCDVLLYDSLSARELLERARPDCERIDVGKRYGGRAASQEEINGLLIRKAREGKTVVRLKGGDPYVFGRGERKCWLCGRRESPVKRCPAYHLPSRLLPPRAFRSLTGD